MASQLRLRKEIIGGRPVFVPATPWDEEGFAAIPRGAEYTADLKSPKDIRNPKGKLYAGLSVLVHNFDNSDRARWPTARSIRNELLIAIGVKRTRYSLDGKSAVIEADLDLFDQMTAGEVENIIEAMRSYAIGRWGYDPWQKWEDKKDAEKAASRALVRAARSGNWEDKGPPPRE